MWGWDKWTWSAQVCLALTTWMRLVCSDLEGCQTKSSLSHGASLRISFATNTCLFACLVCPLILDGLTLAWVFGNSHWVLLTEVFSNLVQVSRGILVSQNSFRIELCLQSFTNCSIQWDRTSLWMSCFSFTAVYHSAESTHGLSHCIKNVWFLWSGRPSATFRTRAGTKHRAQCLFSAVIGSILFAFQTNSIPAVFWLKAIYSLACGMPKLTPG